MNEKEKTGIFRDEREKMSLSIRKLSEETNVSRRTVKLIDEGEIDNARFCEVVEVSKFLGINLNKFIRDNYGYFSGEIYEEELDTIVNKMIPIQMDLIYNELADFASLVKVRIDDFDIKKVLSHKSNLHKLIILNNKLKFQEISIKDALKAFPTIMGSFERRKLYKFRKEIS